MFNTRSITRSCQKIFKNAFMLFKRKTINEEIRRKKLESENNLIRCVMLGFRCVP